MINKLNNLTAYDITAEIEHKNWNGLVILKDGELLIDNLKNTFNCNKNDITIHYKSKVDIKDIYINKLTIGQFLLILEGVLK